MTTDYDIQAAKAQLKWHTSSYSGGQGNCVQVANAAQGAVPVRDSKRPDSTALNFDRAAWNAFITHLG